MEKTFDIGKATYNDSKHHTTDTYLVNSDVHIIPCSWYLYQALVYSDNIIQIGLTWL